LVQSHLGLPDTPVCKARRVKKETKKIRANKAPKESKVLPAQPVPLALQARKVKPPASRQQLVYVS
jgi:hypothetical protein